MLLTDFKDQSEFEEYLEILQDIAIYMANENLSIKRNRYEYLPNLANEFFNLHKNTLWGEDINYLDTLYEFLDNKNH